MSRPRSSHAAPSPADSPSAVSPRKTPADQPREGDPAASPDADDAGKSAAAQPQPHEPQIPELLPILAIRDAVAFPGTVMPLNIGRERSKRLVEAAVKGHNLVGVVAQRRKETDTPTLDDIYRIGTVCAILKVLNLPDGTLNIIVHGLVRFGIVEVVQDEPFMVARIQTRYDSCEPSPRLEALLHTVKRIAYRVFELSPNVPEEAKVILDNIDSPGGVADFLAANLSVSLVKRQELLETFDVASRLRKISTYLTEQQELLELANKIQTQVRTQINKTQREYFLQEQLKAIQKELGETDGRTDEVNRIRERLARAQLPEAVKAEADRELERLGRIPQASPEYAVALDYLTWLSDLPWAVSTPDSLDLRRARRVLDQDHHGLSKIKQRILEFLAVRKLNPTGRGPILCFLGPPGVGKTSLGQSIARCMGRKFVRMSLGGLHDEAQLRGHRRTYIGAMPGRIIQELRKAGCNNPVFMLDEVDKIGQDFRGDPASALLEILDPEQNHSFTDNYLGVPFDLSRVMFIATANTADPIPAPLLDRMETLQLSGYTPAEKLAIAERYLVPRQLEANGLNHDQLRFRRAALERIISEYTREAGVRELDRRLAAVCRGAAVRFARGYRRLVVVEADDLPRYLGPPTCEQELAHRLAVPGIVTGLAYTPFGGEILFIEATAMPGEGKLTLTGHLGEVMRESALAAFSLIRSRAEKLGIPYERLHRRDVHLHVPAGAVPKDGPSAGLAMYTALLSLFTRRPCPPQLAMTGEITLTGRVLPIGGLKEKLLAAARAGIKRAILPSGNRKDLVDVPAEVRRRLKLTFLDSLDPVPGVLEPPRNDESASR